MDTLLHITDLFKCYWWQNYTTVSNTDLYLRYFDLSYIFSGHNDSVQWGLTVTVCYISKGVTVWNLFTILEPSKGNNIVNLKKMFRLCSQIHIVYFFQIWMLCYSTVPTLVNMHWNAGLSTGKLFATSFVYSLFNFQTL